MKRLIIVISVLTAFLGVAISSGAANPARKQLLIDKYEKQLSEITTARDSVRILYHLYDLSDRAGQQKYARMIYSTAGRAEDVNSQIDMLLNLATFNAQNDSLMNLYLSLAEDIPNTSSRAATKTYILNQQLSRKSRHPGDHEFQEMLLDSIMKSHDMKGKDIYDKISLLFQIIQYLGVNAEGVLFKECLDEYATLIDDLPMSDYPLKSQFYTTAAMIHSRMNGNPAKAIAFDRKLLSLIEQLQQMYAKKRRKFRNYDINKFISYRRIMSNYEGLTPEEIETYHDSILALYNRNPDVKRTLDYHNQLFAFYYTAKKDHEKAIPALKGVLSSSSLSAYQKQRYNYMLINLAKEAGDMPTYIQAMEDYIDSSIEIDSLRKVTMKREIMLRDSVFTAPMFANSKKSSQRTSQEITGTVLVLTALSILLSILLAVYATMYIKLRMKKINH